ncbi:MAG: ABC transporter ATP-binding protein [Saprospiraceae bacterium]|nr:ABC transporter ATP-binding protein [Lewinella sp.]
MSTHSNVIEIEDLSFSYHGKNLVLHDLQLQVPRGSIFAFVGENGAGKSTTIKHIAGLIPFQKGKLQVLGHSLQQYRGDIMKKVGFLIESPSCHGTLSGYDNLKIYCRYRGLPVARITEVAEMVRLSPNLYKKCKAYSTGMKQRLGLAIALLDDPELIVLDEPTSGLDPTGRIAFRKLLLDLNQQGKTLLVSSHLLSEIELIATDIGIIKNGTLLFQGSMEELRRLRQKNTFLEIEVSDTARATALLQPKHAEIEANEKTSKLKIRIEGKMDIPPIVRRLSSGGVDIYALQPDRKGLEQLFIDTITL